MATKIVRVDDGSIMRRMRPVRGEPAMVMSDQQARLSDRKRGCRPLERSVVGDLWDLLGETDPLPRIKAPVATATHTESKPLS